MKSFQFYSVKNFPTLYQGKPVTATVPTFLFDDLDDSETVTKIILEKKGFEDTVDLLRIISDVVFNAIGYISRDTGDKRERLNFNQYHRSVDFLAYYDSKRQVLILPQSKTICKAVFPNLNAIPALESMEMEIDFKKVSGICKQYLGAWFRKISAKVSAVGLVGNDIQEDDNFIKFRKIGEFSNVTIPWQFGGVSHPVMITKSAAIVLQKDYKSDQSLEISLVLNVFDNLVSKCWHEKPKRGRSREIDVYVEL